MKSWTWLSRIVQNAPVINPSILAADFAHLEDEIRKVEAAGAEILHLDIMDGHFVPNLSIGIPVVEAIRRITQLPLDVHLMLSEPAKYVKAFRKAGADILTVPIEVLDDPRPLLDEIRTLGAAAGLAHNPPTPIEKLSPFLKDCELVLTMSVMPGFGGQLFTESVLEKVRYIRENTDSGTLISIDGGINLQTVVRAAEAGCHLFVAGTAIFGAEDYTVRMRELRRQANEAFLSQKR
ncbi:MAG: ribulose-phosphate 3-epimerase [Planctomycetaceae bacterium]|nr:ribulose-phosphate 3-epimerase [Planctomycetaceae bacterium]